MTISEISLRVVVEVDQRVFAENSDAVIKEELILSKNMDMGTPIGKVYFEEYQENSFLKPPKKVTQITRKRTHLPTSTVTSQKPRSKPVIQPPNAIQVSANFAQKPSDFIETVQSLETGKKIFTCKFCGLQKNDKGNLGRHILTKHLSNVEMMKCTICDYTTKLKGNMKQHYITKHKLPGSLAQSAVN